MPVSSARHSTPQSDRLPVSLRRKHAPRLRANRRSLASVLGEPLEPTYLGLELMDHPVDRGNQVSHFCHAGQLELINELLLPRDLR